MYTLKYCEEHLKLIGVGSSRRVYELDDKWVIKKAYTNGGIWQNNNELKYYKKYSTYDIPLCEIDLTRSSKDSIVMRKARALSNKLSNAFDYCNENFENIFSYSGKERKKVIEIFKNIVNNCEHTSIIKFFNSLDNVSLKISKNLMYDAYDCNCGIIGNKIVLIDYGYPKSSIVLNSSFSQYNKEYEKYLKNS